MQKQKLPNERTVKNLGLISFVGCCCTNGFLGLIFSGVGWHIANKAEKMHYVNPDKYDFNSLNTWKTLNIMSFGISLVFVSYTLYLMVTGQMPEIMERNKVLLEQLSKKY